MSDYEIKNSGFYSRLSIPTIARIERLMEEFDWKGRDVFLEDAFTVLAHVRAGKPLPDVIEEARQRHADRLLRIKMGEAHDQSSHQNGSAAAVAAKDEIAQPDEATGKT